MQRSGVRPPSSPPFIFRHLPGVSAFSFLASGRILARFCFSRRSTASRNACRESLLLCLSFPCTSKLLRHKGIRNRTVIVRTERRDQSSGSRTLDKPIRGRRAENGRIKFAVAVVI